MGYAKLFSSITESSLWSEPKEARLLFVSMLARADATGFVEAALPGLARLANLTIEETQSAVSILESPDPHSKNPKDDGRRILKVPGGWMVLNYETYRERRDDNARREYMRNYMREYRKESHPDSSPVNKSANSKPSVNHSKPRLAQAEAEAEAEAFNKPSPDTVPIVGKSDASVCEFLKKVVSALYSRPDSQPLSYHDQSLIFEISRRPTAKDEAVSIQVHFNRTPQSDKRYLPRSMSALLGRWDEMVDAARVLKDAPLTPNGKPTLTDKMLSEIESL